MEGFVDIEPQENIEDAYSPKIPLCTCRLKACHKGRTSTYCPMFSIFAEIKLETP